MTALLSGPSAPLTPGPPAPTPHPPRRRTTRNARAGRARADAAVRLGTLTLVWLGLLLVTYWWAAGGGITDLTGGEPALISLGRLSGLWASDLLLVQVLAMARIPLLEHAYGQDGLARLHRLLGFTSFNLMVAHIALITWGYAAGDLLATPITLWDLTWDSPGMLLAVAGTLCLVMVTVTSIRAARGRLRHESWHLLHLYAYLGVGLALPHQLWTGQEFLASSAATVYWWTLWALAAATVLLWRVGLPLWRSARHRLRVERVVPEGDDTVSVTLSGRRLDRLPAEAGQFLSFRFPGTEGGSRAHPYSLSAAPDGRALRITVKALGDDSSRVAGLAPGTPVLIEGPYGRLTDRARARDKVALIGAGVGIAPLRALAEGLDYAPGDAVLLHRHHDRPLFEHELADLARTRGLRVLWLRGRRRSPDSWLHADAGSADDVATLLFWIPDLAERDVFVCGPDAWAHAVRRTALAAGLPPAQLHIETFRW